MQTLNRKKAINLRDQLREARLKAQQNAEAFDEVLFVVERLECYLGMGPELWRQQRQWQRVKVREERLRL